MLWRGSKEHAWGVGFFLSLMIFTPQRQYLSDLLSHWWIMASTD